MHDVFHPREEQRKWRAEDIQQRHLENARALWARVVEKNRRDVEEKSEQLKGVSSLAALLAGFALSGFLQFDTSNFEDTTGVLLPLFGLTMALTVGVGEAGEGAYGGSVTLYHQPFRSSNARTLLLCS
jgi:calcium release-activated calcium channel protein 1